MNIKKFYLAPIQGYQYISKMLPASCRYYPSCSEYAKWQFEFNTQHRAFGATTLRILRCNQFFKGGIDYPLVAFDPPKYSALLKLNAFCGKINVMYWLVPQSTDTQNRNYYVLKDFNATKRTT